MIDLNQFQGFEATNRPASTDFLPMPQFLQVDRKLPGETCLVCNGCVFSCSWDFWDVSQLLGVFKTKTCLFADLTSPGWLSNAKINQRSTNKREALRNLINDCLDNDKGQLILNVAKPQFQHLAKFHEETSAAEVEKSLPRRLLQGKCNLSDDAFGQAVLEGDIIEVQTKQRPPSWHQRRARSCSQTFFVIDLL